MKKLVQSWALGLVATSCFLSLGAQPTYQRYTLNPGGSTAFAAVNHFNSGNQMVMPLVGDFWDNAGNDENAYYNMNPLCGGNIRRQYGRPNWHESFYDGFIYNDNLMAATGQAFQFGGGHDMLFAVIQPFFGTLLFDRRIGVNGGAEIGNDIIPTGTGGFLIGGSSNSFTGGSMDGMVVCLGGAPNYPVLWTTIIGTSPGHDEVVSVHEIGGRFYAVMHTISLAAPGDPGDVAVVELDMAGNVNVVAVAETPGLQQVYDAEYDINSNVLGLSGLHRPGALNTSEGMLLRFDVGALLFSDVDAFGSTTVDIGRGIAWNPNIGSWTVCGYTNDPTGHGSSDGFLATFDNAWPNTTAMWSTMYGTASAEDLFDVEYDINNNVLVCGGGHDNNNFFGTLNEWMLTTDDMGNVPCNRISWSISLNNIPVNTNLTMSGMPVVLTATAHLLDLSCNYESDEVCATSCKRSGVADQIAANSISVSPNPTSGLLDIKLDGAWGQKGEIMDLSGVSVKKFEVAAGNFNLDISDLADGVYFLRLTDEGGHPHIQKVVKM
jgi:Secretion system C-terminal sorting domain